jgi:hypothetical protein
MYDEFVRQPKALPTVLGQTLRTFELSATNGLAITVEQLSAGMYFLRGLGDDGDVVTKILVQRQGGI